MADERRRELERQVSTGDLEAEAKLLLERVRSGELTEERLRLAALLGYRPALRVRAPQAPRRPYRSLARLCDWLQELPLWSDRELRLRLAIAPLAAFRESLGDVHADCLDAAETWLVDPSSARAQGLRAAVDACFRFSFQQVELEIPLDAAPTEPSMQDRLATAVTFLPGAALDADGDRSRSAAIKAIRRTLTARTGSWSPNDAKRLVSLQRDEVVPWALGTGDPVRMRVTKRGIVEHR